VLQALERTGIAGDTLVVFSSDNGSYMYRWPEDKPDHIQNPSIQGYHPTHHEANHIWLGTKADIWEAGHRVPFMVRWPGSVKAGTRCDETVCLTDFMATCADITGHPMPEDAAEDSFSLLPLFCGEDWPVSRAPVIHHSSNGMFSIREGKWKLVLGNGSGGRRKPVGKPFEKPFHLFDLESDPKESRNVIEQHPEIARRLVWALNTLMQSGRSR
jgi:arylsulfatase A-like enzyme